MFKLLERIQFCRLLGTKRPGTILGKEVVQTALLLARKIEREYLVWLCAFRKQLHEVDPAHVRFWEAFGNLRWGIICISQARTYLDGHSKSVELASIGRRVAETEWEILRMIEEA